MASKLIRLNLNAIKLSSSLRRFSVLTKFTPQAAYTSCVQSLNKNQFQSQYLILRSNYSSQEKISKDQLEQKVLDLIGNFDRVKENPAKPEIKLESHLIKDLGLDSLDHVEIIVQLEDAFGYEIPDSDYEKLLTPAEIVNYLQKRIVAV